MKYFIAFLFCLAIGLNQSVPVSQEEKHVGLKCIFQNNLIDCDDKIECAAVSNVAHLGQNLYNAFGIGALPVTYDYTNLHNVIYDIYPKAIDSIVYLNNTIKLDGKPIELHLYFSLENTGHGIRVTDEECFAKLVGLIKKVNGVHLVKVQSNLLGDGVDVGLIGEVVVENQIVKKRRFFHNYDLCSSYAGCGYQNPYLYGGYGK